MPAEVILPVLGETVNEGTIVEWFKEEGDRVERGDVLFSVESDKAVLEVEAAAAGFLRRILVGAGEKVPVLTVVALISRTPDEPLPAAGLAARAEPAMGSAGPVSEPRTGARPPSLGVQGPEVRGRLFASPRARKTAQERGVDLASAPITGSGPEGRIEERDLLGYLASLAPAAGAALPKATPVAIKAAQALGVDLTRVSGSGVGGQITRADVEGYRSRSGEAAAPAATAEAAAKAGAEIESIPLSGVRRIIAERMAASHQAVARVTLVTEADATAFVEAREQLKAAVSEEWGFEPGYGDLLGIIVARALTEFPYMNARLGTAQDGTGGQVIERLGFVNLGMAVDTDHGLLVPVIRDAAQKGLRAFAAELRTLVQRARAGRSLPDDLTGGTFTITNLGMYDVDAFTPIVNPPEAAILGVGRIQPKPVVHEGQVAVRQMWTLSLAFDHRLVDGAPAARFLQRIKRLVESPYLLLG